MLSAMILAHLIGDYLLQTDAIARWKSRELRGVLAHGAIVSAITLLAALLVDHAWWPWALLIGASHTLIDAIRLRLGMSFNACGLFVLDQAAHAATIVLALAASGHLPLLTATLAPWGDERIRWAAAAYIFVTLPAWVVVEFAAGLARGGAPDWAQASNKYISSIERALIATLVLLGQYVLIPLVAAPRLLLEGAQELHTPRAPVYVARWLTSLALALAAGISLQQIVGR
jgi:hypothetical protein